MKNDQYCFLPRLTLTLLYLEFTIWSTEWTTKNAPKFSLETHKVVFIWATTMTWPIFQCNFCFLLIDLFCLTRIRATMNNVLLNSNFSVGIHVIAFFCFPLCLFIQTVQYQYTLWGSRNTPTLHLVWSFFAPFVIRSAEFAWPCWAVDIFSTQAVFDFGSFSQLRARLAPPVAD